MRYSQNSTKSPLYLHAEPSGTVKWILELYGMTFKQKYQFQKIIVLLYLFISFRVGGYRAIHHFVELILYGGSEK
jgi:hypothetical protein